MAIAMGECVSCKIQGTELTEGVLVPEARQEFARELREPRERLRVCEGAKLCERYSAQGVASGRGGGYRAAQYMCMRAKVEIENEIKQKDRPTIKAM